MTPPTQLAAAVTSALMGPAPLLPEQQRDLLEIVEDRYNAGSLIITSQLPSTDSTSSWAIPPWQMRSSIA
jgi:hypothetical protein